MLLFYLIFIYTDTVPMPFWERANIGPALNPILWHVCICMHILCMHVYFIYVCIYTCHEIQCILCVLIRTASSSSHSNRLIEAIRMRTHHTINHFQYEKEKHPKLSQICSYGIFPRDSRTSSKQRGKRAISVRVIEVLLYMHCIFYMSGAFDCVCHKR